MSNIIQQMTRQACKYAPQILMGLGIASGIAATISAVKETPKALQDIEDKKEELGVDELAPVEVVKATWKNYVPSMIFTGLSITSILISGKVTATRMAALSTAYQLTATQFTEYKDTVISELGKGKHQKVMNAMHQKKLDETAKLPVRHNNIIITGNGETLFKEAFTGQLFRSSVEAVQNAKNIYNDLILKNDYASLTQLFDLFGLESSTLGDALGYISLHGIIDLNQYACVINGEPCLVIEPDRFPIDRYDMVG